MLPRALGDWGHCWSIQIPYIFALLSWWAAMSLHREEREQRGKRLSSSMHTFPSPLELSKWIHFTLERQNCNRRIGNVFCWVSPYSGKQLQKFTELPAFCSCHSIPRTVTDSHNILPSGLVGQNDVLSPWDQVSNPTTDSKLSSPHSYIMGCKCCARVWGFPLSLYECD